MATDAIHIEIEVFRKHLERLRPSHIREKDEVYAGKLDRREAILFEGVKLTRPLTRPLRFLFAVADTMSKCYPDAAQVSGRGLFKQLRDHLVLQRKYGLGGKYYYEFQLYDAGHMLQAPFYLTDNDMDVVIQHLCATAYPEDWRVIRDKFLFYEHCQEHALPTIPVLAVFTEGQARFVGVRDAADLPAHDLFSKPTDWWGGMKAMRWRYQPDGTYLDRKGTTYASADVVGSLAKASRTRPFVLQPCLSNHDDLQTLTGETLACVRVITVRLPHQSSECAVAYIALPVGAAEMANFSLGNSTIAAAIDLGMGTVGQAFSKQFTEVGEPVAYHPDTGVQIEGFQLPDWQAGIDLVLEAHSTFSKIAYVGWDVAFTDDGPVLIEGNTMPGIEGIQIAHQRPMGDTRIVRCLNQYLG